MRGDLVKKQIQWILSYIQRESADVWKGNILENLKVGNLEYEIIEEFLANLIKKFGEEDKEAVKIAKFKRLGQGSEDFKWGMNRTIQQRLIESECQPSTIE